MGSTTYIDEKTGKLVDKTTRMEVTKKPASGGIAKDDDYENDFN